MGDVLYVSEDDASKALHYRRAAGGA